jgi:hypothetical protein
MACTALTPIGRADRDRVTDPLSLLQQGDRLAWIFYGWQGVQAEQLGIDLDLVMMEDELDASRITTPVLIVSETTCRSDRSPSSFAPSRGYTFAEQPDGRPFLLAAAPELIRDRAAQPALVSPFQAEAPRWGEQTAERWQNYADWMTSRGILSETLDTTPAFSSAYLP